MGNTKAGRPPGVTLPKIKCDACGVTKSATYFQRKSGYPGQYPDYKASSYNRQCKRCAKPAKPGQAREDVPEIKPQGKMRTARVKRAKKKAEEKAALQAKRRQPNETVSAYKKRVRTQTRVRSMVYLASKGCEECGERDPRTLEYDHKKPADKSRNIARLILNGYSWSSEVLRKEIRKCRILCANCHRKHTIEQQGYYADDEVQRTLAELAEKYGFKP